MADEYIDFELTISSDSTSVPQWMFRDPYRVRAFRSAIEQEYGEVPDGVSLKDAFEAVRAAIDRAAERKLIALEGIVDEPVPLVGPDMVR